MKICPNVLCKNELPDDAISCPKCGKRFGVRPARTSTPIPSIEPVSEIPAEIQQTVTPKIEEPRVSTEAPSSKNSPTRTDEEIAAKNKKVLVLFLAVPVLIGLIYLMGSGGKQSAPVQVPVASPAPAYNSPPVTYVSFYFNDVSRVSGYAYAATQFDADLTAQKSCGDGCKKYYGTQARCIAVAYSSSTSDVGYGVGDNAEIAKYDALAMCRRDSPQAVCAVSTSNGTLCAN